MQVTSIQYCDGKLLGLSLHKGDAELHCVDLTRVKPFVDRARGGRGARGRTSSDANAGGCSASKLVAAPLVQRRASGEGYRSIGGDKVGAAPGLQGHYGLAPKALRRADPPWHADFPSGCIIPSRPVRFSDKYSLPAATPAASDGAGSGSQQQLGAAAGPAASTSQPGPAALFVAQQRRHLRAAGVLAPKAANAGGPPVQVAVAPLRQQCHPPQELTASTLAPGEEAAVAGAAAGRSAYRSCSHPGCGGRGGGGRHRVSAEENALQGGGCSLQAEYAAPAVKLARSLQQVNPSPAAGGCAGSLALPLLPASTASHSSFLAAGTRGLAAARSRARAGTQLAAEVRLALERGDVRHALRLLQRGQ